MRSRVHAARRRRLTRLLRRRGGRHFLVTSLPNVRYLSGFTGSNGALFLTPAECVFITDGRYAEQARNETAGCRLHVVEQGSFAAGVAHVLADARPKRIAFEPQSMSVLFHQRLRQHLGRDVRFDGLDGVVESLRVAKDEDEVRAVRKAARIIDRAYPEFLRQLDIGITEREAQWRLLSILRALGAERSPFEPIVLFGARASLPHGAPAEARLARGDWVLMDYGAAGGGYCADFTRTVVKGSATPEMRRIYGIVRKAQQAGVRAVRPRATAPSVDAAARSVIDGAGYAAEFTHGLGHGVGIEVHEGPRLGRKSHDILRSGMIVTVEPGIYIEGWGGIRIEDTVLVTAKGSRRLTTSTRNLLEI